MKADVSKYPALKTVAQKLGINPVWLWLVIQHESRWNPGAVNPKTGASGLIQVMPATAKDLGITLNEIRMMNASDQLLYVVSRYLLPYKGKMKDLDDTYFTVFYPRAIGKPDSYILGSEHGLEYAKKIAQQNPANNPDKDNYITVRDVKNVMRKLASQYGYSPLQQFIDSIQKLFKR